MRAYCRASWSWSLCLASLVLFSEVGFAHGADRRAAEKGSLAGELRETPLPSATQRRSATDGVLPLGEPITVKLGSTRLQVPAAYLSPWPRAEARNRVNNIRSLRFEFWMPDRRYLEVNPISNASFRPKEPGRAEPARDEFIVRVWDVLPSVRSEPGYVSPEQTFRNETRNRFPPNSSFFSREEEFGLVRFWPADELNTDYSISYRNKEGADPQVLLDCLVPGRSRIFLSCSGRVYFVSENLAFFVVFPKEEIQRWREIITAARDLYYSWKSPS